MTTEEAYIKYICTNCNNTDDEECAIRTRYDNTTYCEAYKNANPRERVKTPRSWQRW